MNPDETIIRKNLDALRPMHPTLTARLEAAEPAMLQWNTSKSGHICASVRDSAGRTRQYASRFDPIKEACQLIKDIDFEQKACVVIMGFGLGYHVEQAARRVGEHGLILVYEPDPAVLRSVLEHIDWHELLRSKHIVICDDQTDRSQLTHCFEHFNAIVGQGMAVVTHPPSRVEHGEAFRRFGDMVTETLAYCRTTLVTTLVNSSLTVENILGNLGAYAGGNGINDLVGAAQGSVGICVGAGPSLAKNVDLLADPEIRRKVILIAAQTALRPLLDYDIRPDFITALDYSSVSRRYYESLPDVSDITLIAESKAHPVIVDSYPGPVRLPGSELNNLMLGEHALPQATLPSGGTVAHLSFYLAQRLGCDPIILIGQDLGFSDGLYYMPGTAVHEVWDCELGRFNTIEMMEWQRIMRQKAHIQRHRDIHDQPIFSDEQMLTYLKQFERDFKAAPQRVIDATEGGMPKQHVETMPLLEAIESFAIDDAPALPKPHAHLDLDRLQIAADQTDQCLMEVRQLRLCSEDAQRILRSMKKHQRDRQKMKKLFARMQKLQQAVHHDYNRAFSMVNHINAVGSFRRIRADRINALQATTAYDKQLNQIERDLENLKWITASCDEAIRILVSSHQRTMHKIESTQAHATVRPEVIHA